MHYRNYQVKVTPCYKQKPVVRVSGGDSFATKGPGGPAAAGARSRTTSELLLASSL